MKSWWLVATAFSTGLGCAVGCAEDQGGTGGAGTTTGSNTSTTPTTSSTATHSTTTSSSCGVDLTALLGSTAACSDCANEYCCVQATTYQTTLGRTELLLLMDCAFQFNTCQNDCSLLYCSGPFQIPMLHECADCLSERCCTPFWDECKSASSCLGCAPLDGFSDPPCCSNPELASMSACIQAECATECDQPVWYGCGAGGAAGDGGAAGHGAGTAGSGGS